MEEIDVTNARKELRRILDKIQVHSEPTCILRFGEPIALVVPVPATYFQARHAERVAAVENGTPLSAGGPSLLLDE